MVMSLVLHLVRGQIFGLVLWFGLGLWRNWWLFFFQESCQSIWFVDNCTGFSCVINWCLLNGDRGGTDGGGVLHFSSNSRVIAVTGTAEATHTLS